MGIKLLLDGGLKAIGRSLTSALLVLACGLTPAAFAADLVPFPEHGLRLQRGFDIQLVADNDTALDTWCMTFDARGRLVVANSQSIRTLLDTDGNGVADDATVFATLTKGAMGLMFDGPALYAVADGALLRFMDIDGNGVADGPPDRLGAYGFGEHGVHSIRKGPDGMLYLIGGNDTGFNQQHVTVPDSPVRKVEAGALLRLTPDGANSECLAHGFRNPYDFDFNAMGDIFTYDSDTERDMFLPWYVPTRLYHVAYAQHHGWRLTGYKRSWPRPEYYNDTVDILARVGRGSPTGVVNYRHTQFPAVYRDGLFFCDWTFGRVFFMPLTLEGAGYARVQPEIFLEPIGMQGFAPSSIAVTSDGALYVSIGGRKTRGAVYRIEYAGATLPSVPPLIDPDLNAVLLAPQPFDAWSRASWLPIAQRLGAQPFAAVAMDDAYPPLVRVRAVEVLTEVHGGLPALRVPALAQTENPLVRARVAWALGRVPPENAALALSVLAVDSVPLVRRCALEAMIEDPALVSPADSARVIAGNLAHADNRVRMAATRLASRVPVETWQLVLANLATYTPAARASGLLAEMWRSPDLLAFPQVVPRLTNLLAQARDTTTRLDLVRLAIHAAGDWKLNEPSAEVFTGYEPAAALGNQFEPLLQPVRSLIPSGNAQLDMEASRLLAMLQDNDPRIARTIAAGLTDSSDATQDFHYLVCLAKVRAPLTNHAPRIAHAVLNLDRKLAGQGMRVKQSWDARLVELVQQLIRREPSMANALLRHPRFALPAHVELAGVFTGERKVEAARRFAAAARQHPAFPWTSGLVELLSVLPREEVFPLFRRHVHNVGVRDAIVPKLAASPEPVDRAIFLGSLGSTQPQVVRASLEALLKLPPDASNTNMVAPLKLLRRSFTEPQETMLRAQLVALLSMSFKQPFKVQEPLGGDAEVLRSAYDPIFNWVAAKYPGLIRAMNADDGEDPVRWSAVLRTVPWTKGDATRGALIFTERGCAACHSQSAAMGPDLAGVVQRMSREDLMNAIAFPSRDIAPAYRSTAFRLRDGQVVNGLVAFESADGWLVQTGAGTSVRLDARDVVSREPGNVSVMPSGLLGGLTPLALADLHAYLRAIPARP